MSNLTKINQLINKICHRPKPADAETSVGLEDNTNIPPKKNKKKITLLQKRLLWCFAGIILLIAGYFWWRMPARMRVIAMIPRGDNDDNYQIYEYTPLGLYCWSKPRNSNGMSKLTLYGWDGKKCWSKQLPEETYNVNMTCSPDGHIAAISFFVKKQIIVMSWRDGRELGKVIILRKGNQLDEEDFYINLSVENLGRIWFYKSRNPTCVIWAIDGTHVAAGQFAIPRMQGDRSEYFWYFSAENNMMPIWQGEGSIVRYLLLTVQGERIIVKKTIIHKNARVFNDIDSGLEFDRNGVLRRFSGEVVNNPGTYLDSGLVEGTDNKLLYFESINQGVKTPPYTILHYIFLYLPTGQQWEILSKQQIDDLLCGTQDGKHILLRNSMVSNNLKLIHEYLSGKMEIDYRFEIINAELALYNNNGDKEVVFPVNMADGSYGSFNYSGVKYDFGSNFTLSPDGKNVGAICHSYRGTDRKSFYIILGK